MINLNRLIMKTRILALLMCVVVMALIGCSKVDDGFNDLTEANRTAETGEMAAKYTPQMCCFDACDSNDYLECYDDNPFIIEPETSSLNSCTSGSGIVLCNLYTFGFEYNVNNTFDANANPDLERFNTCPDRIHWRVYNPKNNTTVYNSTDPSFKYKFAGNKTYGVTLTLVYGNETRTIEYTFVIKGGNCSTDCLSLSDAVQITMINGSALSSCGGGGTQIMLVM